MNVVLAIGSWVLALAEAAALAYGISLVVTSGGGQRSFGIFLVVACGFALVANIFRVVYLHRKRRQNSGSSPDA